MENKTYRERFLEDIESGMFYDYERAIKEDILEWIEDKGGIKEIMKDKNLSDREEVEQYLNDTLWVEDSVTGNGSGSYWFSYYKAGRALSGNFSLLKDAIEEFGGETGNALDSEEAADVTIRCYLLGQCISEVLDEIEEEEEPEE